MIAWAGRKRVALAKSGGVSNNVLPGLSPEERMRAVLCDMIQLLPYRWVEIDSSKNAIRKGRIKHGCPLVQRIMDMCNGRL